MRNELNIGNIMSICYGYFGISLLNLILSMMEIGLYLVNFHVSEFMLLPAFRSPHNC